MKTIGQRRLWFVNTLIVGLIGASSYDIIRDTEHWPFSNYGMYSDVQRSHTLTLVRVFGVTEETPPREIPLIDFDTIQPFDQARLQAAFVAMNELATRKELYSRALRDSFRRYEDLRQAGRHHEPRLKAIRLYRLFWQLDPWARNVDHPDRRSLIFEIASDSREESPHD